MDYRKIKGLKITDVNVELATRTVWSQGQLREVTEIQNKSEGRFSVDPSTVLDLQNEYGINTAFILPILSSTDQGIVDKALLKGAELIDIYVFPELALHEIIAYSIDGYISFVGDNESSTEKEAAIKGIFLKFFDTCSEYALFMNLSSLYESQVDRLKEHCVAIFTDEDDAKAFSEIYDLWHSDAKSDLYKVITLKHKALGRPLKYQRIAALPDCWNEEEILLSHKEEELKMEFFERFGGYINDDKTVDKKDFDLAGVPYIKIDSFGEMGAYVVNLPSGYLYLYIRDKNGKRVISITGMGMYRIGYADLEIEYLHKRAMSTKEFFGLTPGK